MAPSNIFDDGIFDACSSRQHFSSPCLNFDKNGELVPILPVFVSTGDTLLLSSTLNDKSSTLNDNSRAKVTASQGCQSAMISGAFLSRKYRIVAVQSGRAEPEDRTVP
jgi:hypothetical protein